MNTVSIYFVRRVSILPTKKGAEPFGSPLFPFRPKFNFLEIDLQGQLDLPVGHGGVEDPRGIGISRAVYIEK